MSGPGHAYPTPRHSGSSSSGGKKRSSGEMDGLDSSGKRSRSSIDDSAQRQSCASPPSPVAGPSHVVMSAETPSVSGENAAMDRLSTLLSGLIDRLDKVPAQPMQSPVPGTDFSGFHTLSSSEEEEGQIQASQPDPLDDLNQLAPDETVDEDFLKALQDFSGNFYGEEEKGEPLSARLANILNSSLRRRPQGDSVKSTCASIKFPSNVPNLSVPVTNPAITKAMSLHGRLVDGKLFQTNGLLSKALVPIAVCLNDIGDRKGKSLHCYLDGLNNCLRLLTSAVNYINQLRKDIARIHVRDSAMVDICKWECEVGQNELFPFDVTKKCEEIHKAGKLGRPAFRPSKAPGRRFTSSSRPAHRSSQASFQSRRRSQSRPFLGQRPPQGRRMFGPRPQQ